MLIVPHKCRAPLHVFLYSPNLIPRKLKGLRYCTHSGLESFPAGSIGGNRVYGDKLHVGGSYIHVVGCGAWYGRLSR